MSEKLKFLERLLGSSKFSASNNEAEFTCCFKDCASILKGKKKLAINLETDHWHCWVCGNAGKNLFFLLSKVGTKEDIRQYNSSHKAKNVQSRNLENTYKNLKISLPDGYEPLSECINSVIGKKVFGYLSRRGVSLKQVLRYKIGVITSGEYYGRVVFPSFSADGSVNYYTTRNIEPKAMYFGPKVPRDYKTSIILNELYIDWTEPLTIVEGFVDMLKANENCAPLFGSSLQKDTKLFSEIVKNNIPVFLGLDPDAKKKALDIASMFMEYEIPVFWIDISPFKDIGDMTNDQFTERYNQATLLSEKSVLLERIRALA